MKVAYDIMFKTQNLHSVCHILKALIVTLADAQLLLLFQNYLLVVCYFIFAKVLNSVFNSCETIRFLADSKHIDVRPNY